MAHQKWLKIEYFVVLKMLEILAFTEFNYLNSETNIIGELGVRLIVLRLKEVFTLTCNMFRVFSSMKNII